MAAVVLTCCRLLTEATRCYLASTGMALDQLTLLSTGFRNHSDRRALRRSAARSQARGWLQSLEKKESSGR